MERQEQELAAERRRQPRTSIRIRATVLLPDDELLYAHTIDVSSGGVCLSVPRQLAVDDEVRLNLQLEAVGTRQNLLLIARVCYCMRHEEGFRAGLQFVQVSPENAMLLEKLLA